MQLRAEIADLTRRLAAADAENTKAGEYGLRLIEEKAALEAQQEALARDYDATKAELETTRDVSERAARRCRKARIDARARNPCFGE